MPMPPVHLWYGPVLHKLAVVDPAKHAQISPAEQKPDLHSPRVKQGAQLILNPELAVEVFLLVSSPWP